MRLSDQKCVAEVNVAEIADAIGRYLKRHPKASETVEGVAKWWLRRQRYNDSIELVQQALDYLEATGRVKKCISLGMVRYQPVARH